MHESLPSFTKGIKKQDWIALEEQANEELLLEKSRYHNSSVWHSALGGFLRDIFSERDQNQCLLLSWARGITALHPHIINQLKQKIFHTAPSALCFWSKTWANVSQSRATSYLLFISSCTLVMAASTGWTRQRARHESWPERRRTRCEDRLVTGKHSDERDNNTRQVISQVWALLRSWAAGGKKGGRAAAAQEVEGERCWFAQQRCPRSLGQNHQHSLFLAVDGRTDTSSLQGCQLDLFVTSNSWKMFDKQKNKGRSLPWPQACLTSPSYRLVSCSSCILEKTKQNNVKSLCTLHFNPLLSVCRPCSILDPWHMEKWF